jgi:tight adherence protein B
MAGVIVAMVLIAAAGAARQARGAEARAATRRRLSGRARPTIVATVRARWEQRSEGRRVVDELPVMLEDIARALRAGSSLRQACCDAAVGASPARVALAGAMARAERGVPLGTVFRSWATQSTAAELRIAAGALALAATAGGPQARAVDGVALTLRERRAAASEVRAHSAQARLSALVIGALPLAFLAWAALTDRRTVAFLVGAPAGWVCLALGVALEATGALWMRRILRRAAP